MRLLVTRPRPDAENQAELLRERGHEPVLAPLLEIELDPSAVPPLDAAQALIVTSRNALRALKARGLTHAGKDLPVFAVGEATAHMARELGFTHIHAGAGTAEQLVPLITAHCQPEAGPLLHLAGETVAWNLKGALRSAGFAIEQPVVYRAVAASALPVEAVEALRAGKIDGVLLMSPETAKTYQDLLHAHDIEHAASKIRHFCLSGAVAAALSSFPDSVAAVASAPTQEALLALVGPDTAN